MRQLFSKLAKTMTVLLFAVAVFVGAGWLRQIIPDPARPDPPFPDPDHVPPIELASIPWKRSAAHPLMVPQPIAVGGMPWLASVDRPGSVILIPTAIPWISFEKAPLNLSVTTPPWWAPPPGQGAVVLQPTVLPWPLDKK